MYDMNDRHGSLATMLVACVRTFIRCLRLVERKALHVQHRIVHKGAPWLRRWQALVGRRVENMTSDSVLFGACVWL